MSWRRRWGTCFMLGVMLMSFALAAAQEVPYEVASWPEEGRGNHRAIVEVKERADAVRVRIPWRRRDPLPERKAVLVFHAETGKRVTNVYPVVITPEYGVIVFQPSAGAGRYEVYYLPYDPPHWVWDMWGESTKGKYFPPATAEDANWLMRYGLGGGLAMDTWQGLPEARVVAIQARTEFDRFDPMEVIATQEETRALLASHLLPDYLTFPEDRRSPIRMFEHLPYRWVRQGPSDRFEGQAQPGEFYPFQIGIYAVRKPITSLQVRFSDLRAPNGKRIPASAFRCFNLQGTDWLGRPLRREFSVAPGRVRPLWIGVQIPRDASGVYTGTVQLKPEGLKETIVRLQITVTGEPLDDAGDSDSWRLSRLRWLDSTIGLEETAVPPFTPVKVNGLQAEILGRSVRFNRLGFPESVTSNGRQVLASPLQMVVETEDGQVRWKPVRQRRVKANEALAEWDSLADSDALIQRVQTRLEFDGCVLFTVTLQAKRDVPLRDVRLEVPFHRDVAVYMMGMGRRGGKRPDRWEWQWHPNRINNLVWVGDWNAGMQVKLEASREVWGTLPELPASWYNGGRGGCVFAEEQGAFVMRAFTGERNLQRGESVQFLFRLLVTPFKPLDSRRWEWRIGPGGNIAHVHHAHPANPFINYPLLRWEKLAELVKLLRQSPPLRRRVGVNIYYTVRELTNHTPELWALRSLGDEVLVTGGVDIYKAPIQTLRAQWEAEQPGGHPWLKEHLVSGYSPAWLQYLPPDEIDAAVATQGLSRWHNFYLEGLRFLLERTGIDGLYLDGIGYDREIMKRVRRVMKRYSPDSRIDFHSGDNWSPPWLSEPPLSSPANEYMEHFPYLDTLWFGELYDYNMPPDYWLVEISGIPFGLMGDMLEGGGNAYRGMLYGMTGRDRSPTTPSIWQLWDDFGIAESEMLGYWRPDCPVRTDHPDVLATVYRRKGKSLIALASWAKEDTAVRLQVDWNALGIRPERCRIVAPALVHVQPSTRFSPDEPIPVPAGKGWLLIVEEATE